MTIPYTDKFKIDCHPTYKSICLHYFHNNEWTPLGKIDTNTVQKCKVKLRQHISDQISILEGPCVKCGTYNKITADHIYPFNSIIKDFFKEYPTTLNKTQLSEFYDYHNEVSKYQALCLRCNI